eukprot:1381678-Heterocapsa_arctica.AAC.1
MESGHREGLTKYRTTAMETVCYVENKNARVNHLWWDCIALNKHTTFGYLKLNQIRHREGNQP